MNIIDENIELFEGYNEEILNVYELHKEAYVYLDQVQTSSILYNADPTNVELYEDFLVIYNAAMTALTKALDDTQNSFIANIINQIEEIYTNTITPIDPVEPTIPPLNPPEEPSESTDWWKEIQDWVSGAINWINTQDDALKYTIWAMISIIILLIIRNLFFSTNK